MSTSQELVARIGLDWADQQHEICLQEAGSARVERMQLPQSPEAIAEWVAALRQRFGGRPVGICLETTRGPVVSALLEHAFLVLYPVNPRSLRRFREAFSCSGAKDDPDDAGLLLEMLSKHEERLHPWQPDDGPTRALRRLVEARRKAVDLRTQLVQQLTAELKGYFPQALGWAGGDLSVGWLPSSCCAGPPSKRCRGRAPRGSAVSTMRTIAAGAISSSSVWRRCKTPGRCVRMRRSWRPRCSRCRRSPGSCRRSARASRATTRRSRRALPPTPMPPFLRACPELEPRWPRGS